MQETYQKRKSAIQKRLEEFSIFFSQPLSWHLIEGDAVLKPSQKERSERIFEELSFCTLTANASCESAMRAVDAVRPILSKGSQEELQKTIMATGYRFHNRASYIVENRKKFIDYEQLTDDPYQAREFLAKKVKGLGYKEASHFLRNIGVRGLAILDKHVLRTLKEKGVIDKVPKSLSKKSYMALEKKYLGYADKIGINPDELDILMWSIKTGKIMK